MKKTLALVLSFALVFSSFGMAFADTQTSGNTVTGGSVNPTPTATATPAPTTTPTATPTGSPTATPTASPTATPTGSPTASPTATPAATATPATMTDAQACTEIGMIKGTGSGVTPAYLATVPTRIQAAVMFLRLKGLEAEALAFTGTENFSDAGKAVWAKPIMAYLKSHPEFGWIGSNGNFMPNDKITAAAYYKVMLETLGYKQNTADVVGDFAWEKVLEFAASKGLSKVANASNFTVDNMTTATIEALKATNKDSKKTLAASLVAAGKLDPQKAEKAGVYSTVVKVDTVTATSAKTFLVTLTNPVADVSKVVFTVQRATTPITMTVNWNNDKTEATLTSSSNLPEGDYSVSAKNDTTDLGTSTVKITVQKVAKITILSKNLSVVTSNSKQYGYATYKVEDQYGQDITASSLAGSINFQVGVGTITPDKGILKITPSDSVNLIQFSSVTITAVDSASATATSATLGVSAALGTLSEITLGELKNVNNKALTGGDTTSKFTIDYVAKDISGNETKSYELVKAGLILAADDSLNVSSNYITAKVIQENDSKKAVLEVVANNASSDMAIDMPISITAVTVTGKTSTITVTLKKPSKVDTFTLLAPGNDIAVNESKELPFVANDQNGTAMTRYSDLVDGVTLTGAHFEKKVDGTAKVMSDKTAVEGQKVFTAVTKTGKFSQVSIMIRKAAVADTLKLDSTVVISNMQVNASQKVDLGYDKGGLSVEDQYDRVIDMIGDPKNYTVAAKSSNAAVLDVSPGAIKGNDQITMKAKSVGTATVTFELLENGSATKVSSKTLTISVVKDSDIKGYVMDTVSDPIYAIADLGSNSFTDREKAYTANPSVYGTLSSSNSKVLLAGKPIVAASVSDSTYFAIEGFSGTAAYDGVNVIAGKLPSTKTDAKAELSVMIEDVDGQPVTLKTEIKSSSTNPATKSVEISADTAVPGVSKDGDVVTVKKSSMNAAGLKVGNILTRYDMNGKKVKPLIHFYAKDQYGTKAMKFSSFVMSGGGTVSAEGFKVNSNGEITVVDTSKITSGSYALITAVTSDGSNKSMKLVFVD